MTDRTHISRVAYRFVIDDSTLGIFLKKTHPRLTKSPFPPRPIQVGIRCSRTPPALPPLTSSPAVYRAPKTTAATAWPKCSPPPSRRDPRGCLPCRCCTRRDGQPPLRGCRRRRSTLPRLSRVPSTATRGAVTELWSMVLVSRFVLTCSYLGSTIKPGQGGRNAVDERASSSHWLSSRGLGTKLASELVFFWHKTMKVWSVQP